MTQPSLHELALQAETPYVSSDLNKVIAPTQGWQLKSYGAGGQAWHDTLGDVNRPMFLTDYAQAINLVPQGWIVKMVRGFDDDGDYYSHVVLTDSFSVGRGRDEGDLTQVQARGPGEPPQYIVAAALKAQVLIASRKERAA